MTTERRDIWKDLLSVLSEEELIRIRRRLEKKGDLYVAQLIEVEINKRGRA